jgi:hypothetical protein
MVSMAAAVYDSILEHRSTAKCIGSALVHASSSSTSMLEVPRVALLVEVDLGSIVAFVEILENGGEDFRRLARKLDSFAVRFEELSTACFGEEGRFR